MMASLQGGGVYKEDCVIRTCVRDRGYPGCGEWPGWTTCSHLAPLLWFHPHLAGHLGLIREHGQGVATPPKRPQSLGFVKTMGMREVLRLPDNEIFAGGGREKSRCNAPE